MLKEQLQRVYRQIESSWSGAWPEYAQAMRRSLLTDEAEGGLAFRDSARWVLLPGLCCQAAGGDIERADGLAAAWFLLYTAAHLMDHVEDQDEPDPWWVELGPGCAVNVATGLFFCASRLLNRLHLDPVTRLAAPGLVDDFYSSFLIMSGGQHHDLLDPEPTLEQCWENAAAKSGVFFSVACRGGARLATEDRACQDAYSRFGHHLGLLIQILDDVRDVQPVKTPASPSWQVKLGHSLPTAYALQFSPVAVQGRLRELIKSAEQDLHAAEAAVELIEQAGAGLYLALERDRQRNLARTALEEASPQPPAAEILFTMLENLGTELEESV